MSEFNFLEVCPDCNLKQPEGITEGYCCTQCGYTFWENLWEDDRLESHQDLPKDDDVFYSNKSFYEESEERTPLEINYVEGDLFNHLSSANHIVVPHICNVNGSMAGGFAKTVREKYPATNEYYEQACQEFELSDPDKYEPMTFFTPEPFGYFANATIQTWSSGTPGRNATYSDLVFAMEEIRDYCFDHEIGEIWSCKFGAGLCGMDWNFIEELIKDIWLLAGLNVTIFVLPQAQPTGDFKE